MQRQRRVRACRAGHQGAFCRARRLSARDQLSRACSSSNAYSPCSSGGYPAPEVVGDFRGARDELDETLGECESGRGPGDPRPASLRLGARIALVENDLRSFETHQAAMERWFRPTYTPALVAMCERLRYDSRRDKGSGERRILLEPDEVVSHVTKVRRWITRMLISRGSARKRRVR